MEISKYNTFFKSEKHGFFLYSSLTNSFMKLNEDLYNLLLTIKEKKDSLNKIDKEIIAALTKSKVIVEENYDDNFFIQKQYLSYLASFSENGMGVIIVPTMSCNFACPYCYEKDVPTEIMTDEVQDKIIKFIINNNNNNNKGISLCWHGGEPLVAFNRMIKILDKLRDENISLSSHDLVTNGYLLNREKCEILKKYNLNSIQITIDGLPDEHNKSRIHKTGVPTYDTIVNNIDLFTELLPDCQVNIRVNVHDSNKKDFPKLYKELSTRWKGKNCYIYMKYVTDNDHCKVKCLSHKEKINFVSDLYLTHKMSNINFFPENQDFGCAATTQNTFIFGPFGEMYKCWADVGRDDRIVGNVNDGLTNISLLSEYMVGTNMFSDPKCKNCHIMPICSGGCPLIRYENKYLEKNNNVCPIDLNDLPKLLELHYEQHLEKKQ